MKRQLEFRIPSNDKDKIRIEVYPNGKLALKSSVVMQDGFKGVSLDMSQEEAVQIFTQFIQFIQKEEL